MGNACARHCRKLVELATTIAGMVIFVLFFFRSLFYWIFPVDGKEFTNHTQRDFTADDFMLWLIVAYTAWV